MNGNPISHPAEWVLSLELFELSWSVLIQELVDGEETAAHLDVDAVLVATHVDLLAAEFVDTFALTHEHDLELASLRVVVDVFSKPLVNCIFLYWDIDCNTLLEINDVLFKRNCTYISDRYHI